MWCQASVSDSGSNGNSEVLSVKKSDGRRRRRSTDSEEASRKIELLYSRPLPPPPKKKKKKRCGGINSIVRSVLAALQRAVDFGSRSHAIIVTTTLMIAAHYPHHRG